MNNRILFDLLKCKIDGTKFENHITKEDAEYLFELADKQDILHIIADDLLKFLPDQLKSKAKKSKMLAIYRRESLDFEESRISTLFSQNSINHIPLKGAIIKNYYPEKWLRTSSDIDILVPKEKADEAMKMLCEEFGYTYSGKSLHDIQLYSKSGVHIELHFSLDGMDECGNAVVKRIWEYGVKDIDSSRYSLSPEFTVFYNILHAKYHFAGGGCGIKPFLDMYVMSQNLDYDDEKLNLIIKESKIDKFAQGFIQLSRIWFYQETHNTITQNMEDYILTGGVYGTRENLGKANIYIKGGKFKYLLNRIFKPKNELEAQYPNLKKYPLLLPFYQIKRWFNLANKERRNDINAEFSGSKNAKNIEKMFKDLGI